MSKKINPHDNATEIERVADISDADFYKRYIKTKTPVVITGRTASWPAMKKWSLKFFAEMDAAIQLEQGNVMQDDTTFIESGFQDYIQKLNDLPETPPSSAAEENGNGKGTENGQSKSKDEVPYLSVFDIFSNFPDLCNDVDFSLMTQFKRRHSVSGWIGPAGSVTGYHIDWADNLFAQSKSTQVGPVWPHMHLSHDGRWEKGCTLSYSPKMEVIA